MAKKKKDFQYWPQVILGTFAIAVIVFASILMFKQQKVEETPKFLEKRLPAGAVINFNNKNMKLTDLLTTDRNLLIFWATWCGPCVEEIKQMHKLLPIIKKRGYSPVFVNYDPPEKKDVANMFAKKNGIETSFDLNGGLLFEMGVNSLPVSFTVDKSGKILRTFWGELSESNL